MMMILQNSVANGEIARLERSHVDRGASVLEASKLMRRSGKSELIVTRETSGMLVPLAVLTAKDIVTRVIAAELDPAVVTTGDIAWPETAASESAHSDAVKPWRAHENI